MLIGRQRRRPAGLGLDRDRVQPAIALGVGPGLHEATRPAEHGHDRLGLLARGRELHDAIAVAMLGIGLPTDQPSESLRVVRAMKGDIHVGSPKAGADIMPHNRPRRNLTIAERAWKFLGMRISERAGRAIQVRLQASLVLTEPL